VHRPAFPLPNMNGVQPTAVDTLSGLKESQNLTSNRGNIIHAEAPARIFRKDAVHSGYGNIAKLHSSLGENFAKRMSKNFDIIILSMANFIRPKVEFDRILTAMKSLDGRVPFMVLGAGMQGNSDISELTPSVREVLSFFNNHALVFGVRGKFTESWLHANGYDKAQALGCPSLYSFPQSILSIDASEVRTKGNRANVMTAGYLTLKDGHNFQRGKKLAKAMEGVRASYVFQDEFLAYRELAKKPFSFNEGTNTADAGLLNSALSVQTGAAIDFERYYYFTEASAWRQATLAHDLYLGDRFHGGVAALQAGQPAIFLAHDTRVQELTDFFGFPRLTIDEFAKMGLADTIDKYLSDDIIGDFKETYRKRYEAFSMVMANHGLSTVANLPEIN